MSQKFLEIVVTSPSNIALVKYWGKHHGQLPFNPSLSMTLSKAKSILKITMFPVANSRLDDHFEYFFEGKKELNFQSKVLKFLKTHGDHFPNVLKHKLVFHGENTFPHSSGIASSASSFSALAYALMVAENYLLFQKTPIQSEFKNTMDHHQLQQISHLGRMGSGSACRSIFPGFVSWGEVNVDQLDHEFQKNSWNNLFATPVNSLVDDRFKSWCDTIFIVSDELKKVSSSEGHELMNTHPFRNERIQNANRRWVQLMECLQNYRVMDFCDLVESEALELHAMMMTSTPNYLLMKPLSLEVIQLVRSFREDYNVPVCFTLDAGPNVHILYPREIFHQLEQSLFPKLESLSSKLYRIDDELGNGPQLISMNDQRFV